MPIKDPIKHFVPSQRLEQLIGSGMVSSSELHDIVVELIIRRTYAVSEPDIPTSSKPSNICARNDGDVKFLEFIYARLKDVYGETPGADYMLVLRKYIDLFRVHGPEIQHILEQKQVNGNRV